MRSDLSVKTEYMRSTLPGISECRISGIKKSTMAIWLALVGGIIAIGIYLRNRENIGSSSLNLKGVSPEKKCSMYQRHLPPDIYNYIMETGLVNESLSENIKEKQNLEGIDRIGVAIETYEGNTFAVVSYCAGKRSYENTFGAIQIGYQNGKVFAYTVFDTDGADYVLPPDAFPYSEKEESNAKSLILDLWENGIRKTT